VIVANEGRAILSTPVYEEKTTEARLRQRHPFATEKGVNGSIMRNEELNEITGMV
jgi:hypothetical protein